MGGSGRRESKHPLEQLGEPTDGGRVDQAGCRRCHEQLAGDELQGNGGAIRRPVDDPAIMPEPDRKHGSAEKSIGEDQIHAGLLEDLGGNPLGQEPEQPGREPVVVFQDVEDVLGGTLPGEQPQVGSVASQLPSGVEPQGAGLLGGALACCAVSVACVEVGEGNILRGMMHGGNPG